MIKVMLASLVLMLSLSGISFANGGNEEKGKSLSEGTGTRGGKLMNGQEGKGRMGNGSHGKSILLAVNGDGRGGRSESGGGGRPRAAGFESMS